MFQSQPSEQLGNQQAHTTPQHDSVNVRDWTWVAPETPAQHESNTGKIMASDHDNVHVDLDAVHKTPKTATPRLSRGHNVINNAYSIPTPVTAKDFSADGSPGRSSGNSKPSLTSTALNTDPRGNRQLKPFLASPLSGVTKRQSSPDPSSPAQGPKRQRMLLSQSAHQPQLKTVAGQSHHFERQGLQLVPTSAERSAVGLSGNGATSGEMREENHVGMRQSRGAGLRINTQAAELAAPPPPRKEPTREEQLYADYVKTHDAFRTELNNLALDLDAAKMRAKMAEVRAREAENMTYKAKNANFTQVQQLTQNHRADIQAQKRKLRIHCKAFEESINEKDKEIIGLKRELQRERQASVTVRSELAKTVQEMSSFKSSFGR